MGVGMYMLLLSLFPGIRSRDLHNLILFIVYAYLPITNATKIMINGNRMYLISLSLSMLLLALLFNTKVIFYLRGEEICDGREDEKAKED